VREELQERARHCDAGDLPEALRSVLRSTGLLAPFLQKQTLAIPICPKARVLKMAGLYDLRMTIKVLDQEIFGPARSLEEQVDESQARATVAEIQEKVEKELTRCVEEPDRM
ncbi:DNAJ1, partial [Symbiodinium natans]